MTYENEWSDMDEYEYYQANYVYEYSKKLDTFRGHDYVFLDLETTGLNYPQDEILEIAIIDSEENVLLHTYVKPTQNNTWKVAQKIHGITPQMVKKAPTIHDLMPTIHEILNGKNVVAYNVKFECSFIPNLNLIAKNVYCAATAYAECFNEYANWLAAYKQSKLEQACNAIGFFDRQCVRFHGALADTLATRALWHWLIASEDERKAMQTSWKVAKTNYQKEVEYMNRYEPAYQSFVKAWQSNNYKFLTTTPLSYKQRTFRTQLYQDLFEPLFCGEKLFHLGRYDKKPEGYLTETEVRLQKKEHSAVLVGTHINTHNKKRYNLYKILEQ